METMNSARAVVFRSVSILLAMLACVAVDAAALKVMRMGLGSGTITSNPAGINCGATCDATFGGAVSVTLTATPAADSTFAGWDVDLDPDTATTPDCTGAGTCVVTMATARSARPVFNLTPAIPTLGGFTATDIQNYLTANTVVDSPARFIKGLPTEFKQGWILMSRSESLQTGTAESPRVLLPSADARFVFSIGMTTHASYPGAHPNAIEYMQWDATQKNFRFHEIVLAHIDPMGSVPARERGVSPDDSKCPRCHSTRNVRNPSTFPGTDGVPPGTVKAKNKPNWDTYDSWGGMLVFNRDRIYQGSVEAAAVRKIFNPWTWRGNDTVRSIVEQLKLQPPPVPAADAITRLRGGPNDGVVKFAFDVSPPVTTEPAPVGSDPSISTNYNFNGAAGSGATSSVTRGGTFITLHASATPSLEEGRGVQLFDLLGGLDGSLNQQRVADELLSHHFATGSVPIDVRPVALAITKGCISVSGTNTITSTVPLTVDFSFFDARNGMSFSSVLSDTRTRSQSIPRRKADIEKINLDRSVDPYLFAAPVTDGLIQHYGATTSGAALPMIERLRQEVFRRPLEAFGGDSTVLGGIYVDREQYGYNTNRVALYRYFLEPLGVSIDKWSMGVRGRSRTYTFADIFATYANTLQPEIEADLTSHPIAGLASPYNCSGANNLLTAVNSTLSSLPGANDPPTFTDVQRIFNKSCIECHGGLGYPPYGPGSLNFSEDESPPSTTPPLVSPRLARSYANAAAYANVDPTLSYLYQLITRTNETCPPGGTGMMPCGGPPLSKVDIETIRRWMQGNPTPPSTSGDPHLVTVENVHYDFQSAGEFVLLRDENLEVQARQSAIATDGPLGPNDYTGLRSCVSLNSAAAVRVGTHRVSYEPDVSGRPNPEGLQLRVDGKLMQIGVQGINLAAGGRIIRTTAPGGIQIEGPGGAVVVLTPAWWDHYQVWYMNIDVPHARANQGVIGALAPGSWLPALPDGTSLGPRPRDLHQRYLDLYVRFEDAWRVSDATSLFDYSPGTSTRNFSIENWPVENPESCVIPPQPEAPPPIAPLQPLALEVAQQHCNALLDANRKANCVQDVMVTGEPGFAKTYLLTEQIARNKAPFPPVLGLPDGTATDLERPIQFTWNTTSDPDGDVPTYRHCVWISGDLPTFNQCDSTPIKSNALAGRTLCVVLLLLLIAFLIVVFLFVTMKPKRELLGAIAIAILVALIALYLNGRSSGSVAKTVTQLEPGKTYLWKVIAEDGKGGTTESETRRFTTK